MREVLLCDATQPEQVARALKDALNNNGPAILVRDPRAMTTTADIPPQVDDDTALLIQTSGSSGKPKTVALSAAALISSAQAAHERLGGPGQWLLALPLTYIAGLSVLVRSSVSEIQPVFMPAGPFDGQTFLEKVTVMEGERKYSALVPVQLSRLLDEVERNQQLREVAQSLDAILIGGQALEGDLRERAQEQGLHIVTTYGSSETAGGCVYDGIPLANVEVKIDADSGEILISAPQLARGYVGDEVRTAETFQKQNSQMWYRTGDAGTIEDGTLRVHGRLDRVIISGGLKIDLDAVQAVVTGIPGCGNAVVVNIPDSEWGQRPAVVVPAAEEDSKLSAVIYDEIVAELGRVAAPKTVLFTAELPRLSSGKPDLVSLAAYAATAK